MYRWSLTSVATELVSCSSPPLQNPHMMESADSIYPESNDADFELWTTSMLTSYENSGSTLPSTAYELTIDVSQMLEKQICVLSEHDGRFYSSI